MLKQLSDDELVEAHYHACVKNARLLKKLLMNEAIRRDKERGA